MKTLFVSHIRPILEFASPVWNMNYVGDTKILESVQRSWTKQIDGLCDVPYNLRLEYLQLYSVRGRMLRADLVTCWRVLHGHCPELQHIFHQPIYSRTRGHSMRLFQTRASSEPRHRFFTMRVVPLWNSLSEAAVSCDSISSFKKALHRELYSQLHNYYE